MKKTTAKQIGGFCAILLLVYVAAYIAFSIHGRYEPAAYGLGAGPDGETMVVPKLSFGYVWMPAVIYPEDGTSNQPLPFIYQPMIGLDHWVWHTRERIDSGRYRILNWFDTETRTYSNIEPQ